MPLSIFKKLNLPDPKPTYMSLQLAGHSITYPRGIVEDVLVKVDKLIFPTDFVILDFEEGKRIPIILGRPFLATTHEGFLAHKRSENVNLNLKKTDTLRRIHAKNYI